MTERADRAVEVLEWRKVVALTVAVGTAGAEARETQECYERKKRSAEDGERRLKGRARGEVARWATGILADPDAVVLGLATVGPGDRVEAAEVALLDTGGRTLLHERVRTERGPADARVRVREALAPAGLAKRVVVFDRPPVLRLLARHVPGALRALSRGARGTGRGGGSEEGDAAGDATGIEDARKHFYRAYGEWNSATEDYCDCTFLPGGTARRSATPGPRSRW